MKKYTTIIFTTIVSILIGSIIMASVNAFTSPKPKHISALKTYTNAQKQLCEARKQLGEAKLSDYANKLISANTEELEHFRELSEMDCEKDFQ